jgi:hypothetical protein
MARGPGRPSLTDEQAAARAVWIIDVALALHNGQRQRLRRMGLRETQARRLVAKRHRGRVGEFIGNSVADLFPSRNPTAGAVRFVLEHGAPVHLAIDVYDLSRRALVRAVRAGWNAQAVSVIRRSALALHTTVEEFPARERHTGKLP